jgi:hypothetical protein
MTTVYEAGKGVDDKPLMGISLDQVVPWGRSLDEYRRMFDLTPAEMEGPILGCPGKQWDEVQHNRLCVSWQFSCPF